MIPEGTIEGIREHRGGFIYGLNQHPNHVPNVTEICSVDEFGNLANKKKPTDAQIISNFWAKQQSKLALLLIISAGIPFSILVQETNIFDLVFGTIFSYLAIAFNYIVQVFV